MEKRETKMLSNGKRGRKEKRKGGKDGETSRIRQSRPTQVRQWKEKDIQRLEEKILLRRRGRGE